MPKRRLWVVEGLEEQEGPRSSASRLDPLSNILSRSAICILMMAFGASQTPAQRGGGGGAPVGRPTSTPTTSAPSSGGTYGTTQPSGTNGYAYANAEDPFNDPAALARMAPVNSAAMDDNESCNPWTEAGVHSPTVSMARLSIPGKASSEYKKACGALKDKKLPAAETHVRNAIAAYPNYAAAWVVLGDVLDEQHKHDDAQKACSQAETIDPSYSAPYLCLANFAAEDNDWKQVELLADRAMAVNPIETAASLYLMAAAAFHTDHVKEAEANALEAVRLDLWHHIPEVHLLLAHVYQAKGDIKAQAEQLKEYIKMDPGAPNYAEAKAMLAQIDAHP
jgi:tetratricopeptide (TPR) repeat protein